MTIPSHYFPPPCSSWPAAQLEAVGAAFREAGGAGAEEEVRFAMAVQAYLHAGGTTAKAESTVHSMIASLSKERGEWLWGPIEAWVDKHRPASEAELRERQVDRHG